MAHPRRSPEEIERGLTALILAATSQEAAAITGTPDATLRNWKIVHRDKYDRLCETLEPQLVKRIAAGAEDLALLIEDRERKIIETFTDDEILRLEPKDKAATLRNLSTSKALQLDKVSSPLRERPGYGNNQGPDLEGLIIRMARLLGQQTPTRVPNHATIEGSAVPLSTASDEGNAHSQGQFVPRSS